MQWQEDISKALALHKHRVEVLTNEKSGKPAHYKKKNPGDGIILDIPNTGAQMQHSQKQTQVAKVKRGKNWLETLGNALDVRSQRTQASANNFLSGTSGNAQRAIEGRSSSSGVTMSLGNKTNFSRHTPNMQGAADKAWKTYLNGRAVWKGVTPNMSTLPQPGGIALLLFLVLFIVLAIIYAPGHKESRLTLTWKSLLGMTNMQGSSGASQNHLTLPQEQSLINHGMLGILNQIPGG